ncbi:hypothetical protein KGF57_000912 [Candida theae]|uniref:Trafficking protein particle complex subunit 11 domain-containing protein n=1 Tax=Candida theae TaxID=1198502 RepID=A0AAD5BIA2_9ASCO|nr:uncharacterized protein KGF57_000912 [Candida theae]KAI5965119.1 hypothetical protein KGF57_000912 [Candida theae]
MSQKDKYIYSVENLQTARHCSREYFDFDFDFDCNSTKAIQPNVDISLSSGPDMENYNQSLLQQLNPLLRIHIDSHIRDTEEVKTLLTQFELYNVKGKVWDNSAIRNRLTTPKYILSIQHGDEVEVQKRENVPNQHSVISPFNKDSPIFPNGILTHHWFEKYITSKPFGLIYVCELDSAGEDVEFAITMKKLKLKLEEIDCKLILLLITPQPIDEERMNMFRAELNFPKPHSLFNLSKSSPTLQSDSEVLVSNVLSSLTKPSHGYYANLEYKLKQRYKKVYDIPPTDDVDTSIELSPKFLEIRNMIKQGMILQFMNPTNLEPGVKILEIAYQDLISLLDGIYAINLSEHDNTIIGQLMTLLDIIAFHIVRGYFTIEEPIKALRKHKTHIINVVEVLKRDHDWISVQYEWLAQLMKLIPYSIITNLNSTAVSQLKAKSKNANTLAMMSHFGGIHTPEFDLITNPGLVLVKAYEMSSHGEKKIELLQNAIETLETNQSNALNKSSVSGQDNLDSLLSYLTWLIGEEYFASAEYKKASDYFEMAYSSLGSAKWSDISYFLLEKLLKCYIELGVKKSELNTILKLSTIPKRFIADKLVHSSSNVFEFDKSDGISTMEVDILDSKLHELFLVDALLVNNNLSSGATTVGDEVLAQIDLKSKLDLRMMRLLLPQTTDINVSLNQIDVIFSKADDKPVSNSTGLKNVSITNDGTKQQNGANLIVLKGQELSTTFADSANLSIASPNSSLTIQQVQKVTNTGHFQIDTIKLQITIELRHGGKVIRLNKIELHQTFPHSILQQRKVKLPNGLTKTIRLGTDGSSTATATTVTTASVPVPPHQLVVTPPTPDLIVTTSNDTDCYIVGERLSIPLKYRFKNGDIFYKADLMATVKHGDVVVTWDKLKDEEPLVLKGGAKGDSASGDNEEGHVLHVYARNWSGDIMNIEISLAVTYSGDEDEASGEGLSAVYKVFELQLPVIAEPFKYDYSISPYLDEKSLDLYVRSEKESEVSDEEAGKVHEAPLLLRQWKGKLRLNDQYALRFGTASNGNDEDDAKDCTSKWLQVVDVDFDVISGLPDLQLTMLSKRGKYDQLFATQLVPSGKMYRNAQIITSMTVKWKRPDSGDREKNENETGGVNELTIPEWKVQVPLVAPRVLLFVKDRRKETAANDEDDIDFDHFAFHYVIENPSVHELAFVCELTDFDKTWQIDTTTDKENDDLTKQYIDSKPFTVRPNSRKVIQFQMKKQKKSNIATDTGSEHAVRLPTFKLFDINYKVYLYVAPTQSNVKVKNGNLYIL